MPSTIATSKPPPVECIKQHSSDGLQNTTRQSRSKNRTLVGPVVATFPLASSLPQILCDLSVPVDTSDPSVTMQYSVHICPRQMRRELELVFPDVVGRKEELIVIPTFQRTQTSMVSYAVETQTEKDAKLHQFYRWSGEFVSRLRKHGYWADVTDPMSGMALFTTCGPSLYPDVEGAEVLLRYAPLNLGMCFVLLHPQWGTHVYPATAFTLAPASIVQQTLDEMQCA
ncbi:hypothetical protein GGH12_000116 [Coemansia sp. RSA 1822]|nr:hypothetical protein LPJ76_002156 [Coemansia sp. RSA 638]KAJ2126458.1 hypothetical protein IW147_000206 [Coemansia sp. RSA 720]KAJ2544002.1 hypothetical protein GGF49_001644 [Coemansia sp. RSA 1853]KAJ2567985.1 hypothetical protein GGH12_000116 [Coemansia sp. RSA 1822]